MAAKPKPLVTGPARYPQIPSTHFLLPVPVRCGGPMDNNIVLVRALRERGLNSYDVRRMAQRAELVAVRRGAYVVDRPDDQSVEQAHRDLIRATVPQLDGGAVISHGSAAVLHGLPTWSSALGRVHVTRDRSGGGQRRPVVHVHGAPLAPDDRTVIDGVAATSLARTVLDLGRTLPMEQAVAAGDQAMSMGLNRTVLERGLVSMDHWPGVRRARRVVAFLDGRSESAGESVSRIRLVDEGLPAPDLQQEIFSADGRLVARVDFLWRGQRTVGEFDGKIKYGRLLKPGQSLDEVLYDEKLREDAVRDLGWQVVRWRWQDLYRQGVLRDRVLRAFDRAR